MRKLWFYYERLVGVLYSALFVKQSGLDLILKCNHSSLPVASRSSILQRIGRIHSEAFPDESLTVYRRKNNEYKIKDVRERNAGQVGAIYIYINVHCHNGVPTGPIYLLVSKSGDSILLLRCRCRIFLLTRSSKRPPSRRSCHPSSGEYIPNTGEQLASTVKQCPRGEKHASTEGERSDEK